YRRDADPLEQPARPVRLVDTIGAGDAFPSGLLGGLAPAGVRRPASLPAAGLGGALGQGRLVAALRRGRDRREPPPPAPASAPSSQRCGPERTRRAPRARWATH